MSEKSEKKLIVMPLLIRLLHTLDKIDLAIEFFQDKKLLPLLTNNLASIIVISDKLIEQKRYKEFVNFFENHIVTNLPKVPSSILAALTLSLLKLASLRRNKSVVFCCN